MSLGPFHFRATGSTDLGYWGALDIVSSTSNLTFFPEEEIFFIFHRINLFFSDMGDIFSTW
jgi:hypothetical protein